MASGSRTSGVPRRLSEIRVVILGNDELCKSTVVKSVLGCKRLMGETVGRCKLYEDEQDGRRISVVDAPGWDKVSMQQTPKNIKKEIERSVSFCPPGPHALLLVIPVKRSEQPSIGEIEAVQTHVEFLSERVWKHTVLLFVCDERMGDFAIKAYFEKSKKILEKCNSRSYVLESRSKISELFTKIDELVEENNGDVFLPHAYYELIQRKIEEASGKRKRSGSLEKNPPNMAKAKHGLFDFPRHTLSGEGKSEDSWMVPRALNKKKKPKLQT